MKSPDLSQFNRLLLKRGSNALCSFLHLRSCQLSNANSSIYWSLLQGGCTHQAGMELTSTNTRARATEEACPHGQKQKQQGVSPPFYRGKLPAWAFKEPLCSKHQIQEETESHSYTVWRTSLQNNNFSSHACMLLSTKPNGCNLKVTIFYTSHGLLKHPSFQMFQNHLLIKHKDYSLRHSLLKKTG